MKKPNAKRRKAILRRRRPATRAKQAKGKVKKKPLQKRETRLSVNQAALTELIERGRPRGVVTDNEILYYFPDIEKNVSFLDEIYDRLEKANIKVIETSGLIEVGGRRALLVGADAARGALGPAAVHLHHGGLLVRRGLSALHRDVLGLAAGAPVGRLRFAAGGRDHHHGRHEACDHHPHDAPKRSAVTAHLALLVIRWFRAHPAYRAGPGTLTAGFAPKS